MFIEAGNLEAPSNHTHCKTPRTTFKATLEREQRSAIHPAINLFDCKTYIDRGKEKVNLDCSETMARRSKLVVLAAMNRPRSVGSRTSLMKCSIEITPR